MQAERGELRVALDQLHGPMLRLANLDGASDNGPESSADRGGCVFLSPPEIKQQQLRDRKGGYERADLDSLLDNVVGSYQHVWLERDRLQARVAELERDLANTKELEKLLRDGLASAQRAAEQVKQEAEAQVSGLVDEARAQADTLLAEARAQADE